jgi:hypothetical protein
LPEGAVARLGTTKFRTSGMGIVLALDGTRAAVRVPDGIDVLNLDTGEVAGYVEYLQLSADGELAITVAPGATAPVWKLPK